MVSKMTADTAGFPGTTMDRPVLVVAHPDDEVLWFSSVLEDVDSIFTCFSEAPGRVSCSSGREAAIRNYPLSNMSNLGLTEADAFDGACWQDPIETNYGLSVSQRGLPDAAYKANFARLLDELRPRLADRNNVFTHNPWGEYGHVEHVQVYRAVTFLRKELGFRLWYSNYCSNKSALLMLRTLPSVAVVSDRFATNRNLAAEIKSVYQANDCWTWYDHYEWPETERFFLDSDEDHESSPSVGNCLDLNMLIVEPQEPRQPRLSLPRRLARRISVKLRRT